MNIFMMLIYCWINWSSKPQTKGEGIVKIKNESVRNTYTSVCKLCIHVRPRRVAKYTVCYGYIKTHGSESRGQEEAAVRDERVSYLHVALL